MLNMNEQNIDSLYDSIWQYKFKKGASDADGHAEGGKT